VYTFWVDASKKNGARLPTMTDSRDRSVIASALMMCACLVLGLLAGGMLVIGISFVSFWRSLTPSQFQGWFGSYAHLIGRLMIPLGVGGVAGTVRPSPPLAFDRMLQSMDKNGQTHPLEADVKTRLAFVSP
jgi:hypothetical protein